MTFDEFLARLENVRGSGNKRTARCPAHADHDNSLSIAKGDKVPIIAKCFAGCSIEQVCAALNIDVQEIMPPKDEPKGKRKKHEEPPPPKPLTFAELAAAKGLPVDWLREHGVADCPPNKYTGVGVIIGYFNEDDSEARHRIRTGRKATEGIWWVIDKDDNGDPLLRQKPIIPYGLWRLREWRT